MITNFTFTHESAWNHTIQFLVAYRDLLVYDLSNCFANFGNALIFVLTFACVVYVHSLWFRFWIEPRAWEPRSATHLEWYIIWHILLLLLFFSCLHFIFMPLFFWGNKGLWCHQWAPGCWQPWPIDRDHPEEQSNHRIPCNCLCR